MIGAYLLTAYTSEEVYLVLHLNPIKVRYDIDDVWAGRKGHRFSREAMHSSRSMLDEGVLY